jgi:hypothetical protein
VWPATRGARSCEWCTRWTVALWAVALWTVALWTVALWALPGWACMALSSQLLGALQIHSCTPCRAEALIAHQPARWLSSSHACTHCTVIDLQLIAPPLAACRLPAATAPSHSWQDDLCHQAPNVCDPQGRLLVLNLAGGGLSCPAFPTALSRLSQLTSLDLGHNSIKDSAAGAAQVGGLRLAHSVTGWLCAAARPS